MKPLEVVQQLDRFIVGQSDAKRAVAIALRNRWRRLQLPEEFREEVIPKNILMVGPTGCGKTEIARRLAKLAQAPFIKVEATKFTEVGFHGRDVDMIIRDLVDIALVQTRTRMRSKIMKELKTAVEDRILDALTGAEEDAQDLSRETFRQLLRDGELDDHWVELDLPDAKKPENMQSQFPNELVIKVDPSLLSSGKRRAEKRRLKVGECKPLLEEAECDKLINNDLVTKEALESVNQNGIVFLDEIDKICQNNHGSGTDASAEGVQRDLLPLIEGCTISTKHGNVNTDHILFIASGAFHHVKPSEMLPELQGRLPIRVELQGLARGDLLRILTEPETNICRQQIELMSTENLRLQFDDDAVGEIAGMAAEINATVENIGARRLHTVMERLVEDISFNAPEMVANGEIEVTVTAQMVAEKVGSMLKQADLSKFIL